MEWAQSQSEYLADHHIEHYLSDAVTLLTKLRIQAPPGFKIVPASFFAEYFESVQEGRHVLFREYEYITATDHSRRSFIKWCQYVLEPLCQPGVTATYTIADYFNILTLMCKDFPLSLVKSAAAMLLVEDGLECLVSVQDFLTAFRLRLLHDDFLTRCETLFQQRQNGTPLTKEQFLSFLHLMTKTGRCTIPLDLMRDAVEQIDDHAEVLDIFNCLVRSEAIKKLNSAPSQQSRLGGGLVMF